MRRCPLVARVAIGTGALAIATGCTFLIGFDEVPVSVDGGDETSSMGPPDVRLNDSATADARVDSGTDTRDAIANPDACRAKGDGKCCGNKIDWPADRKDELVTCKAGGLSLVKQCTTGQGCMGMLSGFPDECDECASKSDGTFCGRDFPGWDTKNAQQRIRCESGRVVGSLLCAVCKSNGVNSGCQ